MWTIELSLQFLSFERIISVKTKHNRAMSLGFSSNKFKENVIIYYIKITRHLLLGRKVITNLDNILKSRDITLPTKVHLVKAMVFPVVMYGWESWTIKIAECLKIDAFELWCWRRAESSLDSKEIQPVHPKGDQSWIFIGRTDAQAEAPILWPLDAKNWLIGKDLDFGKDWKWEEKGTTGWDGWMASPTQWAWVWVNSRSWWWTGRPGLLQSMGSQRVRPNWATELNWIIYWVTTLFAQILPPCTWP